MDAKKYMYNIFWSEEDQEYVGQCAEFPGLSWLAASRREAELGIIKLVRNILQDMKNNNEPVPEPIGNSSLRQLLQAQTCIERQQAAPGANDASTETPYCNM